jgi:hypothetical protein
MKNYFALTIALFSVHLTIAQNPGNVGTTNLTAWFMPDALPLGNATTWTTTYPVGINSTTVTDALTPYPQATNTPVGDVSNYNTTLEFTGNTTANLKAFENNASPNFLNNINGADQGTFFCAYLLPTATSNDHLVLYNETGLDAIQLRNLGANGLMGLGKTGNSVNGARTWAEGFVPSIVSYKGNKTGATTMNLYDRSSESLTSSNSASTGPTGLYFGVKPGIGSSPLNGYLHEVIFYNTDLTNLEMVKVNTYLAIKYGATLLNTGGGTQGDYISTNGNTVWFAAIYPTYHNDVIGIARDDNQGLLQKQSHSYDDTTRIYLNALTATNTANSGAFSTDNSYVTIGHNTDQMCATIASNAEIPGTCGLYSRLEREWKVTNTNFTDQFNLDLTLNACANQGSVNPNELRLLVDDDGNFSNGGTTCYFNGDGTGIVISYANPVVTVSNISNTHLSLNTTNYITIASIQQSTPLPVGLMYFTSNCADENPTLTWATSTELNNDYFTIERSRDGLIFETMENIDALGTGTTTQHYSWMDSNPLDGTSYYRLSQTDFNSTTELFETVSVNCGIEKTIFYPNPFNNEFTLVSKFGGTITIFDSAGKLILEQFFIGGKNSIQMGQIDSGVYTAFVTLNNGKHEIHKLIKL